MRTESNHNRLAADALCQGLHLVEDGLMPKVDAIEGADGDHGLGDISSFYDISKNFHL